MKLIETPISDLYVLEPRVFSDERGFFFESYNAENLQKLGINIDFRQDNHSLSQRGTIRGLHFQKGGDAQTKLVRCVRGSIFDVAVDLREGSETHGQWFGVELTAENKKQLLVPQGFAHGFAVWSDIAEVLYKCDNFYAPQSEAGLIWSDPHLSIDWGVETPIVSAKDQLLPTYQQMFG